MFLLLVVTGMNGQQSNTLFLMHAVPQSNQLNPAVQPDCKLFIGVPVFNTVHIDYANSSFTYNELTADNALQLDAVYNKLNRMNMVSAEAIGYPLSIGYKLNNNYFSFSISERFNTYNSFSKKLLGLILYGNQQYVGEVARLNNTRANLSYYREYSLGWAFEWDRFTSFGVRGNLLFGKGNLNTGSSRLRLGTDEETFVLSVFGDVAVNSSYPLTLQQNASGAIRNILIDYPNFFPFLMNPRNVGYSMDFGLIHQYSNEITLSASLIDLGVILWTDDVYNVKANVDFVYEGVMEGTDFSVAAYFRDLSDSLVNDIIYDVSERPYLSPLPTQLFFGGTYRWRKNVNLGLVSRNVLVNRRIKSSLTASVNATYLSRFQGSLSWTYMNNSPFNIGVGIAYTGSGVQFYGVSDNVIGLISPLDSRSVNFRVGMNLLLGCPRNYYRIKSQERTMLPCPTDQRFRIGGSRRR